MINAPPENCLLGKVIADNYIVHKQSIISILSKAWKNHNPVTISPWKNNLFKFAFENKEDVPKILRDSPWSVMGYYVALVSWDSNKTLNELEFNRGEFWIQVHDLPLGMLSSEYAIELAKSLGKLIESDCVVTDIPYTYETVTSSSPSKDSISTIKTATPRVCSNYYVMEPPESTILPTPSIPPRITIDVSLAATLSKLALKHNMMTWSQFTFGNNKRKINDLTKEIKTVQLLQHTPKIFRRLKLLLQDLKATWLREEMEWIYDKEGIQILVRDHFPSIYMTNGARDFEELISVLNLVVSATMNAHLQSSVTDSEIYKATKQLEGLKALGEDGFPELNKTLVVFIPKDSIVANEAFHYIRKKKNGEQNVMALKVDLNKAFDRVKWDFLFVVLRKIGFGDVWCGWIRACLTTYELEFMVNGDSVGVIKPQRGLHQGDPISPYLFIIVADVLSRQISKALSLGTLSENRDVRLLVGQSAPKDARLEVETSFPGSLLNKLMVYVRHFFCGGDSHEQHIHWKNWKKLSELKHQGGLGFRDFKAFNTALLTNHDAFWGRIRKGINIYGIIQSFIDGTHSVQDVSRALSVFATICWFIWRSRNSFVFDNVSLSSHNTLASISAQLNDFHKFVVFRSSMSASSAPTNLDSTSQPSLQWIPSHGLSVKLNCDAAFKHSNVAFVIVVRDSTGYLRYVLGNTWHAISPLHAEIIAVHYACSLASNRGWFNATVESDSQLACSESTLPWSIVDLMDDIRL
ncbi:reverse transcriptase [Tanacetum coccineum]